MARSRNIKPGFFKNELLADLSPWDRLLFAGLWCLADREGRIEDRPKRIKMELFPCDDYQVEEGLSRLADSGFVTRYTANGVAVISITNFHKHQSPHGTEKDSELPDVNGDLTVNERSKTGCVTGNKRKTNSEITLDNVNPSLDNALIPDSLIPDSQIQEKPLVPSGDDTSAYSAEFESFWKAYPSRDGNNSKKSAWKAWKARLRAGVTANDLILAAKRYAEQMRSKGSIGTSYVKLAATFLGPDDHWAEALKSNIHEFRAKDERPPLREGEFYHPEWDAGVHEVCRDGVHSRETGYCVVFRQ